MDIKWIGASPVNYDSSTIGRSIRALVMHEMEGTLAGTDGWFNHPRPGNPTSAHYGVGKSGEIHQYVADDYVAYSNGRIISPNLAAVPWLSDMAAKRQNPNRVTISVEWEGAHTWKDGKVGGTVMKWWEPTEEQYQAGLELCRHLVARHNIQVDRAHIIRHADVDSVNKGWCPGLGFPLGRLIDDLKISAVSYQPYQEPTVSKEVFGAFLAERGSPVLSEAPAGVFYCALAEAGINPALWLAMFYHESQLGKDGVVAKLGTRNSGNLRPRPERKRGTGIVHTAVGKFIIYPTWLAGLLDWIDLWKLPEYQGKSLRDALKVYAPSSDGNDPDRYYRTVVELMDALRVKSGL